MPKEAHVYNGGIQREKLQELLRWERNGGFKERYVKFKMHVWRSKKGVTAHLVVDVMITVMRKVAGVRDKGDRRCVSYVSGGWSQGGPANGLGRQRKL